LRKQIAGTESARHAQERTLRSERGGEAREQEDDAQDMAERDIYEAVHRVDERRLRAGDRALEKIEEGTYGLSDASGKPIPKPRLEAVPEATLTVQEEEVARR
jgi:DnaK suppressor protein